MWLREPLMVPRGPENPVAIAVMGRWMRRALPIRAWD